MKRIAASVLLVALIIAAVYGSAATLPISGEDTLGGGSVTVATIHTGADCTNPTGMVSSGVTCSSINVP